MRSGFIFVLVLILCAAAGGYWLGQHRVSTTPVQVPTTSAQQPGVSPSESNKPAQLAETRKLSLPEIEAGILNLKPNDSSFQGQNEIYRLLSAVNPLDLPQLAVFVDSKVPKQSRWDLESDVIQMWADADAVAAMNYANGLTDHSSRTSGISLVAG